MHPSEQLPIETALHPLPGIPLAALRAQVEIVGHLQQALIVAVAEQDAHAAIHYSGALSNCVSTLMEMTAEPEIEPDSLEGIRARLDALEHVEAR